MVFGDDVDLALQAAVALANSAESPETLRSIDDLDAFWDHYGYTGRHDGDQQELDAVSAIRPALRALLIADRDRAVDQVNEILSRHLAVPRLVRHGDTDWHLHAIDDDAPLADRIMVMYAGRVVEKVLNCPPLICFDDRLPLPEDELPVLILDEGRALRRDSPASCRRVSFEV